MFSRASYGLLHRAKIEISHLSCDWRFSTNPVENIEPNVRCVWHSVAPSSTGLVENSQWNVKFHVHRTDGNFHFSPCAYSLKKGTFSTCAVVSSPGPTHSDGTWEQGYMCSDQCVEMWFVDCSTEFVRGTHMQMCCQRTSCTRIHASVGVTVETRWADVIA